MRLYIKLDLSAIRAQQLPLYPENKNIIFDIIHVYKIFRQQVTDQNFKIKAKN